jgi:hypothetical protein
LATHRAEILVGAAASDHSQTETDEEDPDTDREHNSEPHVLLTLAVNAPKKNVDATS